MNITEFCRIMGFGAAVEAVLSPVWQEMVTTCPDDLPFLDDAFLTRQLPRTGNDPAILPELLAAADIARRSPALKLYAWILHRGLVRGEMLPGLEKLPPPEKLLGDLAGMFALAVALAALPLIEAKHRALGIPSPYTEELFTWLRGTCDIHRARTGGRPGLYLGQYYWMRSYLDGELFRIGRFEYLIHTVPPFVPAVFRSRLTGRLAVLSPDNWCFDADGRRAAEGFRARLILSEGKISGTPITPDGRALCGRLLTLSADEFQPVVTPWEWVPSIHIPGGGGMTPEKVLDSLRRAKDFFRRYFHRDIRMFCCNSWILSPDWERELPGSNLAAFQRLGWMIPSGVPSPTTGLFFVFGRTAVDFGKVPQETSLQRALKRLHDQGRIISGGGIFILTDDLDDLSDGFYRDPERSVPLPSADAAR